MFIALHFLLLALWAGDIALFKENSYQINMFSQKMSDFLADFTNTAGDCAFRSPYDNIAYSDFMHKQYPPFAYIFFWLFSKFSWKMQDYYGANRFLDMYHEPFFLLMLFVFYTLCGIAVFELVRSKKTGSAFLRCSVAAAVVLSFPMLFTMERGNNTLLAAIFTMIYLFGYNSSSGCTREIALVSLAAAAATKLFPAIFGILLLYEKRWRDALHLMIYGILLGVLPFAIFDGGVGYNFPLWVRNARMAAEGHSPFEGCSIAAVIAETIPSAIETGKGRAILLFINYFFCGLLLFLAPRFRHQWETVLAVSITVISVQGQSWHYCLLYLIPFMIMFLNEEAFSWRCICIWGSVVLMMTPYMFWPHTIRVRIFLCVFVAWLIIEGAVQLTRGRVKGQRQRMTEGEITVL